MENENKKMEKWKTIRIKSKSCNTNENKRNSLKKSVVLEVKGVKKIDIERS